MERIDRNLSHEFPAGPSKAVMDDDLSPEERQHAVRLVKVALRSMLAAHEAFGRFKVLRGKFLVENELINLLVKIDPDDNAERLLPREDDKPLSEPAPRP
jgi:hypothetical protein